MKKRILDYFQNDFEKFYLHYLPDLKRGKANCPFHDCDSSSLSVNTATGLFKCHFPKCGASGDIFKFYALKHGVNGDFPKVLAGIAADFGIAADVGPARDSKKQSGAKFVKSYDYTDAAGKLLFQVCRMEPKSFRQRRPDGAGGWAWDMKGVARVLYRLPEVLKAAEVWIVEGEKDADNLAALRFTATTNAGGAEKWEPSYSEALAGKRCIFIPDQDEAGEKHAAKVLPSIFGKAASVKVIELPLGIKDVSDFIKAAPDPDTAAERLSMMAEGAEKWKPADSKPEGTPSGKFSSLSYRELMRNPQPQKFIIEGLLYEDGIDLSFGGTGSYKTFDKIDQGMCIATNTPYHGRQVIHGAVLYVAGEGRAGITKRIKAWAEAHKFRPNADIPFFVSSTSAELIDPPKMDEVKEEVSRIEASTGLRVGYIIFDTLSTNFGRGNENSTADVRMMFANLRSRFYGRCCSIIQHIGYADSSRPRGNSDLINSSDSSYAYSKPCELQSLVERVKLKDGEKKFGMLLQGRVVIVEIGDTQDSTLLFN